MARLAQVSGGFALILAMAACGGRIASETSRAGTTGGTVGSMSVSGSSIGASGAPSASGAAPAGASGSLNLAVPNQVTSKIDLLFDIDTSATSSNIS
jgi:hypothetical protein